MVDAGGAIGAGGIGRSVCGSTAAGGGVSRSGGTSVSARAAGRGAGGGVIGGLAEAACRSIRRRWIPAL
jgi:hypothetical protein